MNQPDPTQLLDQEYLRNNFHDVGFSYLLPELLELFSKQTSEGMQSLGQHCAKQDYPSLAIEAHTLKGTAGSVGAGTLSLVAADLERAAEEGDSGRIAQTYCRLQEVAAQTLQAVTHELEQLAKDHQLDVL
ncbi:MAG: Hpt domain-containing protein [Geobacter sp.]|jgi:HPt (histidine-containing phosphotransfer) domain-containing protein|nr:Hpt domain-containing protein [Geobacter sp.]